MAIAVMKILDYYYLVMLRSVGRKLDYYASSVVSGTLSINLFSLVALFIVFTFPRFSSQEDFVLTLFFVWIIFTVVFMSIFDAIYNEERRERIIIEYKRESRKSRQRGVLKVVLHQVLSFIFLIFSILMLAL